VHGVEVAGATFPVPIWLYALGGAAADYDNDGLVDLYVTCLGANHLFKNLGQGKFADVTAKAGVGDPGFSTSAAHVRSSAHAASKVFHASSTKFW
jgi:hypothetical protein